MKQISGERGFCNDIDCLVRLNIDFGEPHYHRSCANDDEWIIITD